MKKASVDFKYLVVNLNNKTIVCVEGLGVTREKIVLSGQVEAKVIELHLINLARVGQFSNVREDLLKCFGQDEQTKLFSEPSEPRKIQINFRGMGL